MDTQFNDEPIRSVGFVGLGAMGHPMAGRLASAGFAVHVHDVSEAAVSDFLEEFPSASPGIGDVDSVILMLPNSDIVESVLLGGGGLTEALRPGAMVIDMSSSEPMRTRELAGRLDERALRFVDAPVSGGVRGAVAGSLAIMVGGVESDYLLVRPVLEALGKNIFHVGPIGSGHAAKALNNLVSAATVAITSEALHVGASFGIEPSLLNSILNASSGRSNTSENKVEQFMLNGTFGSGFALSLMAKDVKIAVSLAAQLHQKIPVGAVTSGLWQQAATALPAGTDHTAMYKYLS